MVSAHQPGRHCRCFDCLQREGRLDQACPTCGLTEAAGAYCTSCRAPTGPADYALALHRTDAQREAAARLHAAAPDRPSSMAHSDAGEG